MASIIRTIIIHSCIMKYEYCCHYYYWHCHRGNRKSNRVMNSNGFWLVSDPCGMGQKIGYSESYVHQSDCTPVGVWLISVIRRSLLQVIVMGLGCSRSRGQVGPTFWRAGRQAREHDRMRCLEIWLVECRFRAWRCLLA